ncbi:PssE/Cps14G family polysaccharide biosynthesis glycosyltransferase [Sediminibacillus massiliensis]|uniref:PssE/Cps14G family polysaccharide biosynthesis glycosyltransferase n=1 Tax=Sediminibacillus massiliensis TaxID=1926277 RepID=UPI00098871D3|nr:PssE/Cps14G family polysaccharide biosynthesis glycosyltransferase [Sediminibacillus massiliensis]
MIFVTLGTQKFRFDRLINTLDNLVDNGILKENIVAQVGEFNYNVKNIKLHSYITPEEMNRYILESKVIITHGGTGSIISSVKNSKKPIVVPRQKKFKEHVDDHQIEIANLFEEKMLIEPVYNIDDLTTAIQRVRENPNVSYEFDNGVNISEDINKYISSIF